MNLRDVMSRHPLTAKVGETREQVEHLLDLGRVHHLPLMDGDRLVGLWVATSEGLELRGPESVLELPADADATTAVEAALMREHEAVLVREDDRAVGVLTRTNVVNLIRLALTHGLGRRATHPVVLRMIGPPEAGKTTLLMRTITLLGRCEVAVVMTDQDATPLDDARLPDGVVHAPEAHWTRALYGWIAELEEAQLVLLEDTASLPNLGGAAMDEILVLVIPAGLENQIAEGVIGRAAAVVLTRQDAAPADFDLAASSARLQETNPALAVFGTAAGRDDRGLDEWAAWIERKALSRQT